MPILASGLPEQRQKTLQEVRKAHIILDSQYLQRTQHIGHTNLKYILPRIPVQKGNGLEDKAAQHGEYEIHQEQQTGDIYQRGQREHDSCDQSLDSLEVFD